MCAKTVGSTISISMFFLLENHFDKMFLLCFQLLIICQFNQIQAGLGNNSLRARSEIFPPDSLIDNLNYLLNIFGSKKCFIFLDIYHLIPLPSFIYPIVIRNKDKYIVGTSHNHSLNTKTYQCLVQFSIFPDVKTRTLYKNMFAQNDINMSYSLSDLKYYITKPIRVIVLQKIETSLSYFTNETFELSETTIVTNLLNTCVYCDNCKVHNKYTKSLTRFNIANVLCHINPSVTHLNSLVVFVNSASTTQSQLNYKQPCLNIFGNDLYSPHVSQSTKLDIAHTSLWMSVFENHSFIINLQAAALCSNEKSNEIKNHSQFQRILVQKWTYYGNSSEQFLFTQKNHLNNLQFISCGAARRSKYLAFKELVEVFSLSTWNLLLASIIGFTVTWCKLGKSLEHRQGISKCIEFVIRVSLEQVDETKWKCSGVRFYVIAFSLSASLLANLWRSDNTYNMVLPRRRIKPRTLEDLVRRKYNIYLRPEFVSVKNIHGVNWSNLHWASDGQAMQSKNKVISIRSQLDVISASINSDGFRRLKNITGLHKNMIDYLSDNFPNALSKALRTIYNTKEFKEEPILKNDGLIYNTFWTLTNDLYQKYLQNCSKSSLLLQSTLITDTKKRLIAAGIKPYKISVGKERYLNISTVFSLEGPVPDYIVRRAKLMFASGLFERWTNLLGNPDTIHRPSNGRIPPEPKMNGNILLVFTLLWGGQAFCMLYFLLETHQKLTKLFLHLGAVLVMYFRRVKYFMSERLFRKNRNKCVVIHVQSRENVH